MKIEFDTETMYSKEEFERLTDLWLKVGWQMKYPYTFSYWGMPILQIPEDVQRMQEVIFRLKPDVIVETGVAHGGSLVYYASICQLLDHGEVIGVEKGLRSRATIEAHPMSHRITLIEGDSVSREIVDQVSARCEGKTVLVILDSCHSKAHVAAELEAYHHLVNKGSYIVATDGNMQDLHDVPRGNPEWIWNNPQQAAIEFADKHPEFVFEQPERVFNESTLTANVTYWPKSWLKRL